MATRTTTTKKTTRKSRAAKTSRKPPVQALSRAQVPKAIERMETAKGAERFAAGKALCATAERDAARVYPFFDQIVPLMDSKSKVITWNALHVIGHLASVDDGRKVDRLLDRYLGYIRGGSLITAANAMQGAGRIAQSRPDLLDRIVKGILAVEKTEYEKPECQNVAIGQALQVLREIGEAATVRADVKRFVKRQRANTRAAVAKLAGEMGEG